MINARVLVLPQVREVFLPDVDHRVEPIGVFTVISWCCDLRPMILRYRRDEKMVVAFTGRARLYRAILREMSVSQGYGAVVDEVEKGGDGKSKEREGTVDFHFVMWKA